MYLLYTDESNTSAQAGKFFVYAGTCIDSKVAAALSKDIDKIRTDHGYGPDDYIKFNTRERPKSVDANKHLSAKNELLDAAAKHGVKLFSSMVLHDIAKKEKQRPWAIDHVVAHFDNHVRDENEVGLVIVDHFEGHAPVLREKFNKGLVFTNAGKTTTRRLEHLVGFHTASVGTSNFCSVIDVVLGSLRHVVNTFASPTTATKALTAHLSKLVMRGPSGYVMARSIYFSPEKVWMPSYLDEYKKLATYFTSEGMSVAPPSEK